jgi:hypothetical protein
MLFKSKHDKVVYKIYNRKTGKYEGVYQRAYHDKYEFESPKEARASNVHGMYEDTDKYAIHKFKVKYKRVN